MPICDSSELNFYIYISKLLLFVNSRINMFNMKKYTNRFILLSIIFLILGCSSDSNPEDDLFKSVQGKWKLTEYFTDYIEVDENGNPIKLTVDNRYELELKSNNTFISNEIEGYTGGNYTIIRKPRKNLKLEYINKLNKIIKYKYIIEFNQNYLFLSSSNNIPFNDEGIFFAGEVLARIP